MTMDCNESWVEAGRGGVGNLLEAGKGAVEDLLEAGKGAIH
jgi:hypothetical protein